MKYWDSSALVPVLAPEETSETATALLRDDPDVFTWWGTPIECVSALARREREGNLSGDVMRTALERLNELEEGWGEVEPSPRVRHAACRVLRVHPLRAADSLQLAAALVLAGGGEERLEFVCADARLADAAEREGLSVIRLGSDAR